MTHLTWEQQLAACQALSECVLKMRRPGDWYVLQSNVEIGGDGLLRSASGTGISPQGAIEDHFKNMTILGARQYVAVNAMQPARRQVRWNGFMWMDVPHAE